MLRRIINIAICFAILFIGFKVFSYLAKSKHKQQHDKVALYKKKVLTLTLERRVVTPKLLGFGTARGKREVSIAPEVNGIVTEIGENFEPGLLVAKGDMLIRIDSESIRIRIKRINAEKEQVNVNIAKLEQEKNNIERRLKINGENLELSEREFIKNGNLFKKGIVSETAKNSSEKDYLNQRDQKTNLSNQLLLIPIKIREQKTIMAMKEIELALEELNLRKSVIYAPFSGLVGDKATDKSQFIRTGESVGTLVDIASIEIPVNLNVKKFTFFNFANLSALSKLIPAEVKWKAGKETNVWKGFVSRFEKLDEATRTIRVIVEVRQNIKGNRHGALLTKGMFCEVSLAGESFDNAISIPISAIRENGHVYVYESGRLSIRTPEIEERFNNIAVISSGLEAGEKIIISSLENPVVGMELAEM